MDHEERGRPQVDADEPSGEDRELPWELRLRAALLDAARRQQVRRRCRR